MGLVVLEVPTLLIQGSGAGILGMGPHANHPPTGRKESATNYLPSCLNIKISQLRHCSLHLQMSLFLAGTALVGVSEQI